MADRLELREFGPEDAAAVKTVLGVGDRTSLPPEAPSRPAEVDAWLVDGAAKAR